MVIVGVVLLGVGFALVTAVLDEIYSRADRREVARYMLEVDMLAIRSSTRNS
jgi:hypothetical protein